jgi:hypothetical protein
MVSSEKEEDNFGTGTDRKYFKISSTERTRWSVLQVGPPRRRRAIPVKLRWAYGGISGKFEGTVACHPGRRRDGTITSTPLPLSRIPDFPVGPPAPGSGMGRHIHGLEMVTQEALIPEFFQAGFEWRRLKGLRIAGIGHHPPGSGARGNFFPGEEPEGDL